VTAVIEGPDAAAVGGASLVALGANAKSAGDKGRGASVALSLAQAQSIALVQIRTSVLRAET
jgi:hypothetical protein